RRVLFRSPNAQTRTRHVFLANVGLYTHQRQMVKTRTNNRTAYGRFFNARKQSGGMTVAVDITNHLIPWAIAKRMQADAWDEGYWYGVIDGPDNDQREPNPYRDEP